MTTPPPRRALGALLALAAAFPVLAQSGSAPPSPTVESLRQELAALKAQYETKIGDLEKRLADLEAAQAAPPATTPPAPAASGLQPANYFNPAVSVIGNFLAVAGHNKVEDTPSADLRESEVGIQAIVDPYARADFFLSFGESGVGVEEGFMTFTSLPGKLLLKVGRQRTSFGKLNGLHLHVLPWPDTVLPIQNLLGGEEGWIGTGVSLGELIPLGSTFSELTLQAFRGDAEGLFVTEKRSDLAYNGHYRLFRDLGEATNVDLGLSYGQGKNGTADGADTRLQAIDFTLRWKPLQTATYRSASLRGEYFRSEREQPGDAGLHTVNADGWFAGGEWQLAKRWFIGARYEQSQHADDASITDRGEALILTFWPSEFSQLRTEYRRRRYDDLDTANELLFQLQFAIGAHGAHPF